jgi:hypothetical protein
MVRARRNILVPVAGLRHVNTLRSRCRVSTAFVPGRFMLQSDSDEVTTVAIDPPTGLILTPCIIWQQADGH